MMGGTPSLADTPDVAQILGDGKVVAWQFFLDHVSSGKNIKSQRQKKRYQHILSTRQFMRYFSNIELPWQAAPPPTFRPGYLT